MVLVKRSTVAFMILVALVAGAGLGAWGAGAVDLAKPTARPPRPAGVQGANPSRSPIRSLRSSWHKGG